MQFRSYQSSRGSPDLLQKTKIWEAARATSAAPSFFDPIKIGGFREKFSDRVTGANNPVRAFWFEAKNSLLKPGESLERNLKYLVSIGTGVPSLRPFSESVLGIGKTLLNMATETEATAELFHREHSDLDHGNQYFRFSVTKGLEEIGLEETAQINKIMAATRRYVASQPVERQMLLCGKNAEERKREGPRREATDTRRLPIQTNQFSGTFNSGGGKIMNGSQFHSAGSMNFELRRMLST